MIVNLVDKLPAVHSLSGCGTTSKVGPKLACFTKSFSFELLDDFGIEPLTEEKMIKAEQFLLQSLVKSRDNKFSSFNDYRYSQYHDDKVRDFSKLGCNSSSIREHIPKTSSFAMFEVETSFNPPMSFSDTADDYGFHSTEKKQHFYL